MDRHEGAGADKSVIAKEQAEALIEKSESLRFRLIGLGGDPPGAVEELKALLAPFYVLNSKENWGEIEHIWGFLGEKQREALRHEVDELLFLWMVGIETALRSQQDSPARVPVVVDPAAIRQALDVCDRALTFAEAKGPWLALRAVLEQHRDPKPPDRHVGAKGRPGGTSARHPPRRADPHLRGGLAAACFQWGLLCSSQGRVNQSILWLERAVLLDSANYWYQFYLAYLEDKAESPELALDHYSASGGPAARISLGPAQSSQALPGQGVLDMGPRRPGVGPEVHGGPSRVAPGRPRVRRRTWVAGRLRRGRQRLPEDHRRRPGTEYARAAMLNLANIDAESGREDRAFLAYDALLKDHPEDLDTRESRAT